MPNTINPDPKMRRKVAQKIEKVANRLTKLTCQLDELWEELDNMFGNGMIETESVIVDKTKWPEKRKGKKGKK